MFEALLLGADALHPDHPNQWQPGLNAQIDCLSHEVSIGMVQAAGMGLEAAGMGLEAAGMGLEAAGMGLEAGGMQCQLRMLCHVVRASCPALT